MQHTLLSPCTCVCVNPLSLSDRVFEGRQCPSCRSEQGRQTCPALTGGKYAVTTVTCTLMYICFVHSLLGSLHVQTTRLGCSCRSRYALKKSGDLMLLSGPHQPSELAIKVLPSTLPSDGKVQCQEEFILPAPANKGSLAKVHADQVIRSVISNRNCSVSSM